MLSRALGQSTVPVGALSREKQLALLIVAALAALLLLIGLGFAVYYSLHPASAAAKPHSDTPRDQSTPGPPVPDDPTRTRRDDLAARPMRTGSPADAQPSVLSTRDPGSMLLPPSTTTGPAGVPAGFAHTPAGALAQLAAIDKAALDSASLGGARTVIDDWAAPGGPTAATWSGVKAMADFLTAAGLSAGNTPNLAMTATPIMGWVIGPGLEPAPPPSIWPGTDAAIAAGYKELRSG